MALRSHLSQHSWLDHLTWHGAIALRPYLPTYVHTQHLPNIPTYYLLCVTYFYLLTNYSRPYLPLLPVGIYYCRIELGPGSPYVAVEASCYYYPPTYLPTSLSNVIPEDVLK